MIASSDTAENGVTVIPTCREMAERVTDYLEGAMSMASRLQARLHLFQCPACVRYYNQMRRTVGLMADAPPPEPPPDAVTDQVLARLRQANGKKPEGP